MCKNPLDNYQGGGPIKKASVYTIFTMIRPYCSRTRTPIISSVTFCVETCRNLVCGVICCQVHNALVRGAEHYAHHSMFDSVSKIAGVIRKCKQDPEKTKWAFCMMLDRVEEGYSSVGEMSNASLFGNKEKKGNIDVILHLFDVKEHLLHTVTPSLSLDPGVTKALQANFSSVTAYRNKVASIDITTGQRGHVDLTWMAA